MKRRVMAVLAVGGVLATMLTAVWAGPARADTHGPVEFESVHSAKCMDVYGWNKFDGAAVNRWDCHGMTNQQWYTDQYLDGSDAIRGVDSNKVPTVQRSQLRCAHRHLHLGRAATMAVHVPAAGRRN